MTTSIIACIAANGVISPISWHYPKDLQRFKNITMGYPVIMGRNTWESLPIKPLAWRENIVVARNEIEGVKCVPNLDAALEHTANADERFIIGGGQLYAAAIPLSDMMYLTHLDCECDGDILFPEFELRDWEPYLAGKFDGGRFVNYMRKSNV